MAGSLQDQLLNMGLTSKQKVNDARAQKRKQKKKKSPVPKVDNQAQIQAEREEKARRDRELNLQREAQKAQKAKLSQAQQWLEQHAVALDPKAKIEYNFKFENLIKTILVTKPQHSQLSRGKLAIARHQDAFWLMPDEMAARIQEQLPEQIIRIEKEEVDPDDPYAEFQIPDDLMW